MRIDTEDTGNVGDWAFPVFCFLGRYVIMNSSLTKHECVRKENRGKYFEERWIVN